MLLRELSSLLGSLVWAILSVPYAQAHYRSLQNFFIFNSKKSKEDLSKACILSDQARQDLQWWTSSLELVNGKVFTPLDPDIVIHSDASLKGWGACSNSLTTRGPWTNAERSLHINELELIGAFNALRSFAHSSRNVFVRIFMDNNTAVCYLNKHGGTKSRNLTTIAKELADWCESREITVEAIYLPGKLNVIADRESRAANDSSDWRLSPGLFSKIQRLWHSEIDLFANKWNAQLPVFVSWKPQPGATALDAFALNWKDRLGYAFPLFSLIPRCLSKIRREKATIVLVCPIWQSQPWFPLLLELACEAPRVLPPGRQLLTSPTGEPHPLTGYPLMLAAWKLSGDLPAGKAFRQRSSNYFWPATVHPRTLHTSPRGTIGQIGVLGKILIPCQMI